MAIGIGPGEVGRRIVAEDVPGVAARSRESSKAGAFGQRDK